MSKKTKQERKAAKAAKKVKKANSRVDRSSVPPNSPFSS